MWATITVEHTLDYNNLWGGASFSLLSFRFWPQRVDQRFPCIYEFVVSDALLVVASISTKFNLRLWQQPSVIFLWLLKEVIDSKFASPQG